MTENNKLIIDVHKHNCSHCGTKSARYERIEFVKIDEIKDKKLFCMFITCSQCDKVSMHLLKDMKISRNYRGVEQYKHYGFRYNGITILSETEVDALNEKIIMSIPTPTFLIDADIPSELRNLLLEALRCIKENALTGASACIRKAIYVFLKKENATGSNYDEKIKSIKTNWANLAEYLDILKGLKGVTSEQVHEEPFSKFTSADAKKYVAILEEIFREIYVIP